MQKRFVKRKTKRARDSFLGSLPLIYLKLSKKINSNNKKNKSNDDKEKEKKLLKAMRISRTRLDSLRHLAGYFAFQIILP